MLLHECYKIVAPYSLINFAMLVGIKIAWAMLNVLESWISNVWNIPPPPPPPLLLWPVVESSGAGVP